MRVVTRFSFERCVGVTSYDELTLRKEVDMLDEFQVCLRESHLEQMFHMFACLKKYDRLVVVLDHTEPELSEDGFPRS
jgi:hypothetical protein